MKETDNGGQVGSPSNPKIEFAISKNPLPSIGGAHFRLSWLASKEYKQYARARGLALFIAGPIILIAYVACYTYTPLTRLFLDSAAYLPLIGAVYAVLIVAMLVYGYQTAKKRTFRDRYVVEAANELETEEKEVADSATDGKLDLPSLWAANQTRINYYHDIATTQAEQSFRVGMWAAIGGFVAVVILGVVASWQEGTAAIAASIVGVAGAAMSAYVGATFMKTQAQASNQLSKFFLQPVEFARLLGAERLLQTLPPEQRQEIVSTIVKGMMVPQNNEETSQEEPVP
ncbi:hypothetical protein [Arthrobacter sp. AD-310]